MLYRSLLTLILSHAHGDALPARVGANLEAEILKVRTGSLPLCPLAYAFFLHLHAALYQLLHCLLSAVQSCGRRLGEDMRISNVAVSRRSAEN